MANLIFLPNIPIQYKINNEQLKSSLYTDSNGQFSIQLYQGDSLTIFIYDNNNNYIPIHFTTQQLMNNQTIDINLIKKQLQEKNTKITRPKSNWQNNIKRQQQIS